MSRDNDDESFRRLMRWVDHTDSADAEPQGPPSAPDDDSVDDLAQVSAAEGTEETAQHEDVSAVGSDDAGAGQLDDTDTREFPAVASDTADDGDDGVAEGSGLDEGHATVADEADTPPPAHLQIVDDTDDQWGGRDAEDETDDEDPAEAGPQSWQDLLDSMHAPAATAQPAATPQTEPRPAPEAAPAPSSKKSAAGNLAKGSLALIAGVVVVFGALGAVGVVVANAVFGDDGEDATAEQDNAEVAVTDDTVDDTDTTSGTPQTSSAAPTPPAEATMVAGQCAPQDDQQRISGSKDSLRGAIAAFQAAYFADDPDGVKATISRENAEWRDQDWAKVLSGIDDEASYCVELPPPDGDDGEVTATVTMSVPDAPDEVYKQRVTGTEGDDGAWRILQMTAVD